MVSMPQVGCSLSPAAPGFSVSSVPSLSTSGTWVWPNSSTCAPYSFAAYRADMGELFTFRVWPWSMKMRTPPISSSRSGWSQLPQSQLPGTPSMGRAGNSPSSAVRSR